MISVGNWWMWLAFIVFIVAILCIDIMSSQSRNAAVLSTKTALSWILIWFTLAVSFSIVLGLYLYITGNFNLAYTKTSEFLTGYLIELSLSVDNMFIFLMIFQYFKIPAKYQRRVLTYGVWGAIAMRLVLILFGVWLVTRFHWILYLFGLFLVFTGIKMFLMADKDMELGKNPLLRWMNQHLRMTHSIKNEQFFTRKNQLLYVTPLFVVLVLIEISDLIFAIDSIPAIFAITQDPFIVFTSNIFAILGLRALYIYLSKLAKNFDLLKYGLAIILVFIGFKMLVAHWIEIPIMLTLGVVIIIIGCCILLSILKKKKNG